MGLKKTPEELERKAEEDEAKSRSRRALAKRGKLIAIVDRRSDLLDMLLQHAERLDQNTPQAEEARKSSLLAIEDKRKQHQDQQQTHQGQGFTSRSIVVTTK